MNECLRENETIESLVAGRSPDFAHIETCATCADLATVVAAIRRDAVEAAREACVPPSGAVWWKMQRRTQQEATRKASRTVSVVYAATLTATVLAVLAILGGISVLQDFRFSFPVSPSEWTMPLLVSVATCLLLAPFAVYYAVSED